MTIGRANIAKALVPFLGVALALFGGGVALQHSALTTLQIWWLMMVGVSFPVFVVLFRASCGMAAVIAASFVVGFSAQLAHKSPHWFQVIDLAPSSGVSYAVLLAIGGQALVAALVVLKWSFLKRLGAFIPTLGWAKLFALFFILGISTITMMDGIGQKYLGLIARQYAYADLFMGINILSALAFGLSLPAERLSAWSDKVSVFMTLPGSEHAGRPGDRILPLWTAGFVLLVCGILSYFSFQHAPQVEDEVVYLLQAKYLAQGMLAVPEPPSVESFEYYLMTAQNGKWYATTFPGWPMVLAVGTVLGATWLVNPVLAAGSILLAHALFKSVLNRGAANVIILLMASSPWYLLMSSSLMIHTLTITLMLGTWLLLLTAREKEYGPLAFAAGCLMGLLLLTRPMEGLLIGTLAGLWTLSFLTSRRQFKTVIAYGVGCILVGSGLFFFNSYLTGDPLTTPINQYISELWGEGRNGYGFSPNVGPPNWGNVNLYPGHSLLEALIHFQNNLYYLNFEFLGWGIGSLGLALIFVLWGKWTRIHLYLAVITAMTIILYSMYWFAGSFYIGPRYWFLMFIPLIVFSASGIETLSGRLAGAFPDTNAPQRVGAVVTVLGLMAVAVFTSWLGANKYPEMRGYHTDYRQLSVMPDFKNALIFVTSESDAEFGSAVVNNDPTFSSERPIFARNLDPKTNIALAQAFPERQVYFVDGRNGRLDAINIMSGPLSVSELVERQE